MQKDTREEGSPADEVSRWQQENQRSIDAINRWVAENGSFSDFQRSF